MSRKTSKGKSAKSKRASPKKPNKVEKSSHERPIAKRALKAPSASELPSRPSSAQLIQQLAPSPTSPVFSIDIGSISGETTIGDLIVAFPRTRDVLMKHGLRFDVEQAGYLYMTLSVFSAIHGLTTNNLVQELHTASKELPPQATPQQLRPLTPTATAST